MCSNTKNYKARKSIFSIKIAYLDIKERCTKIKKPVLKFINTINCGRNKNNTHTENENVNDVLPDKSSNTNENIEMNEMTEITEKVQEELGNELEKDTSDIRIEYMNVNIDTKESENPSDKIVISNSEKNPNIPDNLIQQNENITLNPLKTEFQLIEGDGTKEIEEMVNDINAIMDIASLDDSSVVDIMTETIDISNDSDSSYDLCN